MNVNIYIIRQHETSDSINFGICFAPEAYLLEENARKRLDFLKSELPEYSGYYYSLESLRTKDFLILAL